MSFAASTSRRHAAFTHVYISVHTTIVVHLFIATHITHTHTHARFHIFSRSHPSLPSKPSFVQHNTMDSDSFRCFSIHVWDRDAANVRVHEAKDL